MRECPNCNNTGFIKFYEQTETTPTIRYRMCQKCLYEEPDVDEDFADEDDGMIGGIKVLAKH